MKAPLPFKTAVAEVARRWPSGVPHDVLTALSMVYGVDWFDDDSACFRETETRRAYLAALADRVAHRGTP